MKFSCRAFRFAGDRLAHAVAPLPSAMTAGPAVLLGAIVLEADSSDELHETAWRAMPGADYIEVERLEIRP